MSCYILHLGRQNESTLGEEGNWFLVGVVEADSEEEAYRKLCLNSEYNHDIKRNDYWHHDIRGLFHLIQTDSDNKAWWLKRTKEVHSLEELILLCRTPLPQMPKYMPLNKNQ